MVRGLGGFVSFRLVQGCDSQQIDSIQSYDSIDVEIANGYDFCESYRYKYSQRLQPAILHCTWYFVLH